MRLINYLPEHLKQSPEVVDLQDALTFENDILKSNISDLEAQFYVSTATWGLSLWEHMLGVQNHGDLSYDDRRKAIILKLRGNSTTTLQQVKNLCFVYGNVEILENYSNYSFTIKFVSIVGKPLNIELLISALREIVPAHLAFQFEFKYNAHENLASKTHYQLQKFTHNEIKEVA